MSKRFKKTALALEITTILCSTLLFSGMSHAQSFNNLIFSSVAEERTERDLIEFINPEEDFGLYWVNTRERDVLALVHDTTISGKNLIFYSHQDYASPDPTAPAPDFFWSTEKPTHIKTTDKLQLTGYGNIATTVGTGSILIEGFSEIRPDDNRDLWGDIYDNGAGISLLAREDVDSTLFLNGTSVYSLSKTSPGVHISGGFFMLYRQIAKGGKIQIDGLTRRHVDFPSHLIGGLYATDGGKIKLNLNNKYIDFDRADNEDLIIAEKNSSIDILADDAALRMTDQPIISRGENSSVFVSAQGLFLDADTYVNPYVYAVNQGKISLNAKSLDVQHYQFISSLRSTLDLNLTGKLSHFEGSIKTSWEKLLPKEIGLIAENDQSKINIFVDGANHEVTADIEANTSQSTINYTVRGERNQNRLKIKSIGQYRDDVYYGSNAVKIDMAGKSLSLDGSLANTADNLIDISFSGEDSSFWLNGDLQGQTKISIAQKANVSGKVKVKNFIDEKKKEWESNFTLDLHPETSWEGALVTSSGNSTITLEKAQWQGVAKVTSDTAKGSPHLKVHLKDQSKFQGTLAPLDGKTEITLNRSLWTRNATLDNLEETKGGELIVKADKESTWEGALNIATGKAEVTLNGTQWKNSATLANVRFDSVTDSEISQLREDTPPSDISKRLLDGGKLDLTLSNGAQWTGGLNMVNGSANVKLNQSQWRGNLTQTPSAFTPPTEDDLIYAIADYDPYILYTFFPPEDAPKEDDDLAEEYRQQIRLWQTKTNAENAQLAALSSPATLSLSLTESTWDGDITLTSGKADVELTKSQWTGNVKVEKEGQTERSAENTATPGPLTLNLKSSTWAGTLSSTQTDTVSTLEDSTWSGSATTAGPITLTNSSWKLTGDSEVTSLTSDAASAVFLEGDARKLTVGKLSGEGTMVLDLAYKDDNVESYRDAEGSDFIVVKEAASGSRRLVATATSDLSAVVDKQKLYFATTPESAEPFNLTGTISQYVVEPDRLYNLLNTYHIEKETDTTEAFSGATNWYLTFGAKTPEINENATTPTSAFSAVAALWRDNDTLLKRVGELHDNPYENGAWARILNRKVKRSGDHSMSRTFTGVQLGYDRKLNTLSQGDWILGAGFTHTRGKPEFAEGDGKLESNEVTLYATNLRDNGHTIDIVGRAGRLDSRYTTDLGDKGKFHNWAASLGVEYGKRWTLDQRFSIEPQAQLTYHYLWGDEFRTKKGFMAEQDNVESLVARLGVVGSLDWNRGAENAGRFYAKASVLHDFMGETNTRISQDVLYRDSDDLGDTWYVVGLGTNVKLGKSWHIYVDAETSLNAKVKTKYNLNAGVRYAF